MTAADPTYPLPPALQFLQVLWRLNHAMEGCSGRMVRALGLTAQQRFVLRAVGAYPGINPGALAGLLQLDPGTVSATLRRLEARGLLLRERDPDDARRVTIRLSAAGRRFDAPTTGTVEAAAAAVLEQTSPAAMRDTVRVLSHLTELLQDAAIPVRRQRARRAMAADA